MEQGKYLLVGAGAISEQLYLKYFNVNGIHNVLVNDVNAERLEQLRTKYPSFSYSDQSPESILQSQAITAGLICLPNHLHAPFIQLFQDHKIPCLVEKPVVNHSASYESIQFSNKEMVFVAQLRRFFSSSIFFQQFIESNHLGKLEKIEISDGGVFSWKLQSNYLLNKDLCGGGVLMDSGVHWIDLLYFLLGDISLIAYKDNNSGGLESECWLKFGFANGEGSMRLSRIRSVKRFFRMHFESGMLDFNLDEPEMIRIRVSKSQLEFRHQVDDQIHVAFSRQIGAFFDAIKGKTDSMFFSFLPKAAEAMRPVQFIQNCYESIA
jgi:predicted dehydrogenase